MINLNATRALTKSLSLPVMGMSLLLLQACSSSSSPAPAPTPAKPSLSISSPVAVEGQTGDATSMIFTLTLSEDAASTLTVDYTTSDDTATDAGSDYTAASGSVQIIAGTSTAQIEVFTIGDTAFEVDETFNLEISNPQGLGINETTLTGVGTITNDDPVDAGYMTGVASVNGMILIDVTGMMHNNRIMMVSPAAIDLNNNVLYDITITNMDINNNITATADLYVNGAISQSNVSLSGNISRNTITATFSGGSGFTSGFFELNYDVNNNIGATFAKVEGGTFDGFAGSIYGIDNDPDAHFTAELTGRYAAFDFTDPGCSTSPSPQLVIPDNQVNIYMLDHDVVEQNNCAYISTGHTGFASVASINSVNTLVYAYANGSISQFAIMTK